MKSNNLYRKSLDETPIKKSRLDIKLPLNKLKDYSKDNNHIKDIKDIKDNSPLKNIGEDCLESIRNMLSNRNPLDLIKISKD